MPRIERVELVEIEEDGRPKKDLGSAAKSVADACAQTAAHYKKAGFSPPWISFLARADSETLGICAFTAAPQDGRVEIAFHTFPPFEGSGVATAMLRALITCAHEIDPAIELFAHTLAEPNASNAILRKVGFEFAGKRSDPEEGSIWEWRLPGA